MSSTSVLDEIGRGKSMALEQTPVSRFQILSFRSRETPKAKGINPSSDDEAREMICDGEEGTVGEERAGELRVEKEGSRDRTENDVLERSSVSL